MSHLVAHPGTLQDVAARARPGDRITLTAGDYGPVSLSGLQGPLNIAGEPGVVFNGGRRRQDFDAEANAEAKRVQDKGEYPGVYEIGMRGQLVLRHCRDIVLSGFAFRGCWPSCIAIDNCQRIQLDHIDFAEGTFAIYVQGCQTRGLLVEHCSFLQDISEDDMWRRIDWVRIHSGTPVKPTDVRSLDGDFLRAWGIAGDVIVRHCTIRHAFNGVHIFHADENGNGSHSSRNVHIHDNRFDYIRDNAVEPEDGGMNWWVFHNDVFNCHKIFSLECERFGASYFVGNCYWFDEKPTPEFDNNGGAVWKLHDDVHPGSGLNHVLHNSFYLRSKYIKKERLFGLRHVNNAIQYCAQTDHPDAICDPSQSFFGDLSSTGEKTRFTTEWNALNIRFLGDMSNHPQFPDALIASGYPLEHAIGASPGFRAPARGDFRLIDGAAAEGAGEAFDVLLPDGSTWYLPRGNNIGAYQGEHRIEIPAMGYGHWPFVS